MWEDTVGEDCPVSVRLGLREKVSEDKFCNAILLDALQHTHTHRGGRSDEKKDGNSIGEKREEWVKRRRGGKDRRQVKQYNLSRCATCLLRFSCLLAQDCMFTLRREKDGRGY